MRSRLEGKHGKAIYDAMNEKEKKRFKSIAQPKGWAAPNVALSDKGEAAAVEAGFIDGPSRIGPASEPAERQATFNAVQKENQIAQKTGQSDVIQINAGSSTSISPSESTYLVDKPTRNRKSIPTSL